MKTFVSLLVFLICSPSFAGINSVGKGGGFAELLALKMDRELVANLSSCLSKPELCQVPSSGRELAQQILSLLPTLQQTALHFTPECSQQFKIGKSLVEIPSCLLYAEDEFRNLQALPLNEISFIVLSARAAQAGLLQVANFAQLKSLFEYFKILDRVFALPFEDKTISLHSLTFEKNYYSKEFSLVFEAPAESIDLTAALVLNLCGKEKLEEFKLDILNAQLLDSERPVFTGNVAWKCSYPYNTSFKAKIAVSALINQKYLVVPNSSVIQITRKESVWR